MKKALLIPLFLTLLSVCSLVFVRVSSVEAAEDKLPEYFGVYLLTTNGDLVELKSVTPFQYKVFEKASGELSNQNNDIFNALSASSAPAKKYISGKPQVEIRPSEIAGFYVYGDYNVSSFFLTIFNPAHIPSDTILIADSDTGPGIRKPGNYVDLRKGWSLEKAFRYVEKKPKLFWIAPREGIDTELSQTKVGFVAIEFGGAPYWPFAFSEEEYRSLLNEARSLYEQKNFSECLRLADKSLTIKPTGEAYHWIAWSNLALNDTEKAKQTVAQGLKDLPNDIVLKFLEADIALAMDEYVKAESIYEEILGPGGFGTSNIYNGLAWAYIKQGKNIDEAIKLGKKALDVADIKAPIYNTLSEAYRLKGDLKTAMRYCEKALKEAPSPYFERWQHEKQKARIQFDLDSKPMKQGRFGKKEQVEIDTEKLFSAVVGTWTGTYSFGDGTVNLRLEVTADEQTNEVAGEFHFKKDADPQWGLHKMKGLFNLRTKCVLLSGQERVADPGWRPAVLDVYAELDDDLIAVSWTCPGSTSFDLHKVD